MQTRPSLNRWLNITAGTVVLGVLYLTSLYSFLLFHSLVEMFSIVVGFSTFAIAWNSRGRLGNHQLLFLGISNAFIMLLDLLHTLAYKGMGVFLTYDANLPTQLWIAARSLQAVSMLLSFLWIRRKIHLPLVIIAYSAITLLLLVSIFTRVFPDCFIEGSGLTLFKKISEYIISLLLLASVALLIWQRLYFEKLVLRLLAGSFVLMAGAELAFTFYISVYGVSNLIGHFFKLVAYFLIYQAIIALGLERPHRILYRELQLREETLRRALEAMEKLAITDELTGLYNRRHFIELADIEYKRSQRHKHPLAAAMLDIDDFKTVNDTFGHRAGDRALIELTGCCRKTLRAIDIIGRYGGDELAIFMPESDLKAGIQAVERLRAAISSMNFQTEGTTFHLTISLGLAVLDDTCPSPDKLLDRADAALLTAKRTGKDQFFVWQDDHPDPEDIISV
jgi:diguanylate cyclase (GGDEF)-like protein